MRIRRLRVRPVLARLLTVNGVSTARPAVRIGPQGRAALVAVLRSVEIFCFAPVAGNHHAPKKHHILTRKTPHTPTYQDLRLKAIFTIELLRMGLSQTSYNLRTFWQELVSKSVALVALK